MGRRLRVLCKLSAQDSAGKMPNKEEQGQPTKKFIRLTGNELGRTMEKRGGAQGREIQRSRKNLTIHGLIFNPRQNGGAAQYAHPLLPILLASG
jgi:hypothetical protein